MEHVGYSIIDNTNTEVFYYGNDLGQLVSMPQVIVLPNGNIINCPLLNTSYSGYKLVERWIDRRYYKKFS